MAHPEHVEILKNGTDKWNAWRKENPSVKPDLSGLNLTELIQNAEDNVHWPKFNFTEVNLSKANLDKARLNYYLLQNAVLIDATLQGAVLYKAYLKNANLLRADLSNADLREADLSNADLSEANLSGVNLSGAILDERTKYRSIRGVEVGINGIWCKTTNSAALMTFIPPGNSMLGNNPIAIVESLRRSRRMFGASVMLACIILLIFFFNLPNIKIPNIDERIPAQKFGFVAMPLSIIFLALAKTFLHDAFKGAHYLQDRNAAMTVGNFPWIMSKYSGGNSINKIESFVLRTLLSLHPIVYIIFGREIGLINISSWGNWVFGILMSLMMFFSMWVFAISQRLQRPILFDAATEEKRVDAVGKVVSAIQEQTASIKELKSAIDNK